MSIPGSANPLLLASAAEAGAYQIERSVRCNSADSAYLSRTPASAGNRTTWTWAGWVKRTSLGIFCPLFSGGTSNNDTLIYFDSGSVGAQDSINWFNRTSGSKNEVRITTQVFRDPSAWQHLVFVWDTNNSTAADRMRLYVNGVQVTSFATSTNPSSGALSNLNTSTLQTIGADSPVTGYFSGYLADVHFIDGQALTPSSFTEVSATTGQLIPKAYTGSFGTNGFWLKFADNSSASALGTDSSGNSNTWTVNNISVTAGAGNDSLVDTPTNYGTDTGAGGEVRGNYATWNPLANPINATTFSNGNLQFVGTAALHSLVRSAIAVSSGKWYAEFSLSAVGGIYPQIGILDATTSVTQSNPYLGQYARGYAMRSDGQKENNNSTTAYGSSFTTGDIIGVAFDADAGTLTYYKNNVSQGTAFSSIPAGSYLFAASAYNNGGWIANFGQRPFAYTAPSGFKALCDTNLPAPVVAKSASAFDVKLYTGNGSTQNITGLGFSPDLVWIKCRSVARNHALQDTVRGALQWLGSNLTNAESTDAGSITSFNSDGFTLGSATGYNKSGETHVAWCWDAGSSTVTNTQGSITSQVRANASAGFSVVTYTGTGANATVGHGLGVAPGLVIVKCRSAANDWAVYHSANTSDPKTDYLLLNSTAATADDNTYWNDTAPTSTVFSIGTNADVNTNTATYVAYCWAPQVGYSSFGSYTGNGSADGPFVYTGFRPRWILTKRYDGGANGWGMFDALRPGYNLTDSFLQAQSSGAEATGATAYSIDILSNGFKVKGTDAFVNQSGGSYIYVAFAEQPFQTARAR